MSYNGDVTKRVKEALVRGLQLDVAPEEIPDEEPLFGKGLVGDSVTALEIVFALEEEFGFEVEDEDLQVELFVSVRSLSEYIEERTRPKSDACRGASHPVDRT